MLVFLESDAIVHTSCQELQALAALAAFHA